MENQVVSFNCVLKNKAGKVISSTYNRNVLTGPQENSVLRGLTEGLKNLAKGERRSIPVKAEDAYGLYLPDKVILFPRSKLPKLIRVGEMISIAGKSGMIRTYKVLALGNSMASLDGNHPLAGQDLIFEIETLDARDATPMEISKSKNAVCVQVLH